jgi:hypothetical protein
MDQCVTVSRAHGSEIEIVNVAAEERVQGKSREPAVAGHCDGFDGRGRFVDFRAAVAGVIGMGERGDRVRFRLATGGGIERLREGDLEAMGFDGDALDFERQAARSN